MAVGKVWREGCISVFLQDISKVGMLVLRMLA